MLHLKKNLGFLIKIQNEEVEPPPLKMVLIRRSVNSLKYFWQRYGGWLNCAIKNI